MTTQFISLDWGTTSFRAYRVGNDGSILETIAAAEGIMAVKDGAFDEVLESHIGAWDAGMPIVASGMITSRQGWVELPYVPCPANVNTIAGAVLRHKTKRGRSIHFIPGVSSRNADGTPDVARGEETQIIGASQGGTEHFLTPGTHCKWIDVNNGEISAFYTYMTGEVFALLKNHSILGRLMTGDRFSDAAFERGVRNALKDPSGFLHRIFSARTLALFDEMPGDDISSYLSGQVIGTEIGHAITRNSNSAHYTILASPALATHYVTAMKIAGLSVGFGDPTVAVKGQRLIAKTAGIIP